MPQVRIPASAMALSIAPAIKSFLEANANAMAKDEGDISAGSKALADAIAYGIAKAFASSTFTSALAMGIAPPGGGPVGTLISAPLAITCLEEP